MDPTIGQRPPDPLTRRPGSIGGLTRRAPFVRRVALSWRRLTTGGAPTLIACSGGSDSTALLLALALTTRDIALGHVVHDMRPEAETHADRDAVRALAQRFDLPFFEATASVRLKPGNPEAIARRERYQALARLALEARCPFVATAHHADDQFETLLMALMRGAGPKGLRGIAPVRLLLSPPHTLTPSPPHPLTLIRPMLHCTHAEAVAACAAAGITWREDATNTDTTRLRAALRHQVLPLLKQLKPESPRRAADTAELMREAAAIIEYSVDALFDQGTRGADGSLIWPRGLLRSESVFTIGEVIRRALRGITGGKHADRHPFRVLEQAAHTIRSESTEPKRFKLGNGLDVLIDTRGVVIRRS